MRFISQGNRNYAGRYKPDREWNKKSQPEYGEKTCTGIRDAIKAGQKIKCKEYEKIETAGILTCGFSLPCYIQKYRHRNIAIL